MGWMKIVEEESRYLTVVGNKLAEVQAASSQNQTLESIYAGFWAAYDVGLKELANFERDLARIDNAAQTGQYDTEHQTILQKAGVSQDRWNAAIHIVACMRCLRRPSEVFRAELRRQQSAIIGSLQKVIRDQTMDPNGLAEDLQTIGELLCSFEATVELPEKKQSKSWIKEIFSAKTIGAFSLGATGGYYFHRWQQKRKAAKEEEAEGTPLLEGEPVEAPLEEEEPVETVA